MGKVLGLDIGIASVGWSLIDTDNKEIIDMGVRLFNSADASNNRVRREARSARRNLRRKKYRLRSIKGLLNEYGFSPNDNISQNPYELRVKALTEKLSKEELYTALFHLAKRRGISYLDEAEDEDKNIEESLRQNRELLKNKHPCQIQLERFENYNKQVRGIIEIEDKTEDKNLVLINVFTTEAYKKEAIDILKNQSRYYKEIDEEFIEAYTNILTRKRDFYVGPGDEFNRTNYGIYKTDGRIISSIFEELIGECSIYEGERRAPTTSFTAQEFNILNDLNNLVVEGRKLTEQEKLEIIDEVLNSKVKSFTYKRMINIIKKVANVKDENDIKGYRIDKKGNPEFHTFEAERKLKLAFENTSIEYENFDINKKDKLAEVLSLSMDYKSLKENCKKSFPGFSDQEIELLFKYLQKNRPLYRNKNPWHSFSLKIMRKMREELYKSSKNQMNFLTEKGIRKNIDSKFQGYKYIPLCFLNNEIYNPVVRRSVNQSIGIINAILKKYGKLEAIIIEMPRETNAKDEKEKIKEIQKRNEKEKNEAIDRIRNEYPVTEQQLYKQKDLPIKIRLWYQQDGRCMYTGDVISVQDLINKPNMFEIDHIIPKSISLDDSLNNKVLVYDYANQIKGQRTPFNAFSISPSSKINYNEIKERASKLFNNKKINRLKFNLLTFEEDISGEVRQRFINRNLVDTRYASKLVLNGLQGFMKHKEIDTQIHVVRGKFTSQVRRKWNIYKDRDESFEHHGVDATIVAVSYMLGQSEGTVRNPFLHKIGKYDRSYWKIKDNKEYDREVYKFPWEGFKNDLNRATESIKYSHKIDTKINRQISDLNPCSTRKIDGEYYIVRKYKNIYDNKISNAVIKKIKDDLDKFRDPNDSMILMRKHDPQTFNKLIEIIDKYEGEKPNPFAAYKDEHGPIRKYSRKENKGPVINNIKCLEKKLGEHIKLLKTENLSNDRKVVLLGLRHFRTDVYFNKESKTYKNIHIKYSDLKYKKGKYVLEENKYNNLKEKFEINKDYEFLFSLHANDIVGIRAEKTKNIRNLFRFLSSRADNPNKITLKPIDRTEFNKDNPMVIGKTTYLNKEVVINTSIFEFKKYHTDILGNIYNVQGETIKLEFDVDNINNI